MGGRIRIQGTLNGEALTMSEGSLAIGGFGEGFVDRRHPHTALHELTGGLTLPLGPGAVSLTAGKGFVAFGTDDPMHRPSLRYPMNHHWAQIPERLVLLGGVRMGWATLEGTAFNGDEPESPWKWPRWDRFGDSWATRLRVRPVVGVEAQLSRARVASP